MSRYRDLEKIHLLLSPRYKAYIEYLKKNNLKVLVAVCQGEDPEFLESRRGSFYCYALALFGTLSICTMYTYFAYETFYLRFNFYFKII